MRRYLVPGLAVIAVAIALVVWTRDGDGDRGPAKAPEPTPAARPDVAPPPRHLPERPARVMPRQRPMPRGDTAPVPASPPDVPPAAARDPAAAAAAAPGDDPELTPHVESAKALFADNDFEAAAALAQQQLQNYPESFWLRSIAVKSLCAMGENERAKELIAEEPRTSQRKRLRAHCNIQGGNPY